MKNKKLIMTLKLFLLELERNPDGDTSIIVSDKMDNWDAEYLFLNDVDDNGNFDLEVPLGEGYYVSYDEKLVEED